MRRRDYYAVLGVSREATVREIRTSYRRLARQYSPDVNVWDERAAGLFEEISEAYRVLGDASARAVYDRLGHRAFGASGETGPERGARGEDLHCPIEIGLDEVLRGVTVAVDVTRREACEACGVTGGMAGPAPVPCPACDGRPETVIMRRGATLTARCRECGGTGWRLPASCVACGDRGVVPRRARVTVTVSPGVDTGSQIRVPGEGHASPGHGSRGDLVVITRVRPHPFFTRKGDNLYCEVPVTVPEAALGTRIEVPTPDGAAVVTVPAGIQNGQVLRIRGKGCPRLDRDGYGDLFLVIRVTIPRNTDPTLEEVLRALQRLLPDNPRAQLWGQRGGPSDGGCR